MKCRAYSIRRKCCRLFFLYGELNAVGSENDDSCESDEQREPDGVVSFQDELLYWRSWGHSSSLCLGQCFKTRSVELLVETICTLPEVVASIVPHIRRRR